MPIKLYEIYTPEGVRHVATYYRQTTKKYDDNITINLHALADQWETDRAELARVTAERDALKAARESDEFWRDWVWGGEKPDAEAIRKELADYNMVMDYAAKVYCHVTGDAISKLNTLPEVVCSVADDYYDRITKEYVAQETEALREELEALKETLRWRSVEDELPIPQHDVPLQIYTPRRDMSLQRHYHEITTASFEFNYIGPAKVVWVDDHSYIAYPTHWRFFPGPPQEVSLSLTEFAKTPQAAENAKTWDNIPNRGNRDGSKKLENNNA